MKIDLKHVLQTLLLGVLAFIGHQVWDGNQIARDNRVKLEGIVQDIQELKADGRETRSDLDRLYGMLSDEVQANH